MSSRTSILFPLQRGIRYGFLMLRRERGWGTSVAALTAVTVFINLLFFAGLGAIAGGSFLDRQSTFTVQLRDTATDRDAQELVAAMHQLPFISSLEYITREKALERAGTLPTGTVVNPFHDAVEVVPVNLVAMDQFITFARQPQWGRIIDPVFFSQTQEKILSVQSAMQSVTDGARAAFVLASIMTGALTLVIAERVRRKATLRSDDLFVTRMMGGDDLSIVLPFATEATILLLCALAFGYVCLTIILLAAPSVLPSLTSAAFTDAFRAQMNMLFVTDGPLIIVSECVVALFIAGCGAIFGTRRTGMTLLSA